MGEERLQVLRRAVRIAALVLTMKLPRLHRGEDTFTGLGRSRPR